MIEDVIIYMISFFESRNGRDQWYQEELGNYQFTSHSIQSNPFNLNQFYHSIIVYVIFFVD